MSNPTTQLYKCRAHQEACASQRSKSEGAVEQALFIRIFYQTLFLFINYFGVGIDTILKQLLRDHMLNI